MLAVPVYKMDGKKSGTIEIDPEILGGRVRAKLIKQAIVAWLDHARQDSARTKRRSDVVGSTKKLYRQKGTGNARAGMRRTPVRRGGGRTFAKRDPRAFKEFPKKMRRLACSSAILARIKAEDVIVLDKLVCNEPKTKVFAGMLSALGLDRGCLFAMHEPNENAHRSARNIPNTDIRLVGDLTAYEVMRRPKIVFTRAAFEKIAGGGSE